jgi:hypothetical protein
MDAVDRLRKSKKKTPQEVFLFVIRANRKGELKMSKCCEQCIIYMNNNVLKKGYVLSKVYYSNDCSLITKTTLRELSEEEEKYNSKYYRKKIE